MRTFKVEIWCSCGSGDTYIEASSGDEPGDLSLYLYCYACGNRVWEDYRIRPGKVPKGVHEEVEEGPFDTDRTMIDEDGNTLVWDKEREIYVNCGVQNGR